MAVAGHDAVLGIQHGLRQSLRGENQVAPVRLVRPAQRHAISPRDARDAPGETHGKLVQRDRPGHEVGDLIEALEPLVLLLKLRRLLVDAALEAVVHRLELPGHVVEPGRQGTELVRRGAVHARPEVPSLDPADGLLQRRHRLEDETVPGVEQHSRADDCQRHQGNLQQVHQRGPAREVRLDASDKAVDVGGKRSSICGEAVLASGRRRACKPLAEALPILFDCAESLPDHAIPGHEQGSFGVTAAQQRQASLELRHLLRQRAGIARAIRQDHAICLHAHASGFVDGCSSALELQGHPQQHPDGADGH